MAGQTNHSLRCKPVLRCPDTLQNEGVVMNTLCESVGSHSNPVRSSQWEFVTCSFGKNLPRSGPVALFCFALIGFNERLNNTALPDRIKRLLSTELKLGHRFVMRPGATSFAGHLRQPAHTFLPSLMSCLFPTLSSLSHPSPCPHSLLQSERV